MSNLQITSKKDTAYKVVFDRIMEELDKGVAPWTMPWKCFPFNGTSRHQYRGINYWMLTMTDHADPRWFTFNQITKMAGAKLKSGSKSMPVVFWTMFEAEDDATGKTKKFPFLKYYNVFNADQIDGAKLPKLREVVDNVDAEKIIDGYRWHPEIKEQGNQACYSPSRDTIKMPLRASFKNDDAYYSTLFHELIHSTGHKDRLNRPSIAELDRADTSKYSFEELVAEMGAAFLCHIAGIESQIEQTASYIEGWKKYLTANPKALVQAASQAQKACDYILGENYNYYQGESEDSEVEISKDPNATVA